MGYTHYWDHNATFTEPAWTTLCDIASRLQQRLKKQGTPLQVEMDRDRLIVTGLFTHETFILNKIQSGWAFCKTAREPYDPFVVAMLISAAALCDDFSWSSDGDASDTRGGIELLAGVG